MPKQIASDTKFYVAMCQVYEPVYVMEDYESSSEYRWSAEHLKYQKVEGKFQAFGANGKVVSAYDSPAKAARYCGKEGFVMEIDPADGRRINASLEEQLQHCEDRMLYWAQEADRINKELRSV